MRFIFLVLFLCVVARAQFVPVARLDTMSIPTLAGNVGSYLETARLVEAKEARSFVKRIFLLPDAYNTLNEPAVCHWIFDNQAGASNGLFSVVIIPSRDRGEGLVRMLRAKYRKSWVQDGFFYFDDPREALPPLVIFYKTQTLWISTAQKPLLWAALNEHRLMASPPDASGSSQLAVHPVNLLAYLDSEFFKVTPLTRSEPLYWVHELKRVRPVIDSFQTMWMNISVDRTMAGVDLRVHVKSFNDMGQMLTTWTDPGLQTESFIPSRTLFALASGMSEAVTNAPFFGTLGHGMKNFALYVAETREFGPYLTYVMEAPGDQLADRLAQEMESFELIPHTRVVRTQTRTTRQGTQQGPEVHTFRLESTAPRDTVFAAPLQALCTALVGECWVNGQHVFATLATAPAADTVIQLGVRRGTGRTSMLERVRRGLQKLPDRIKFAVIASPAALLRSVMMVMPEAEKTQIRGVTTFSEGFTLVIAEERYGFLKVFVQLNANELSVIRELIDRGQPVIQRAEEEMEKRR